MMSPLETMMPPLKPRFFEPGRAPQSSCGATPESVSRGSALSEPGSELSEPLGPELAAGAGSPVQGKPRTPETGGPSTRVKTEDGGAKTEL